MASPTQAPGLDRHLNGDNHTVLGNDSSWMAEMTVSILSCRYSQSQECYDIWRDVHFVCVGAIIPIGLVFNTLALLVFISSWMRTTVPGRYFMALAIADNIVLTGELLYWLNSYNSKGSRLGISFLHTIEWVCQSVHWIRYGARMWSSWITVAITIERYLTVSYPLKMVAYSNPWKSTIVVSLLFVVCFSASSFTFCTLEVGWYNRWLCALSDTTIYHISIVVVVGTFGELLVPSIIVLVFTILILRSLTKARRERALYACQMQSRRSREAQPTMALIAIAIMFLTVRLPYMVTFIIQDVTFLFSNTRPTVELYAAYKIAQVLAVTNYAFNFLLFCLSGSTFRTQFIRFITCKCHQKHHLSTFSRSTSLSIERLTQYHVVIGKGRSASVDILCHFSRKVSGTDNPMSASVERLQRPLLPTMGKRSASVGAEKLLNCHGPIQNCLLPPIQQSLRKSTKTRSLTPEDLKLDGSIPYIDDTY